MIRIGVIGYGYWGPNLVRNFFEAPGAQVACVSDLRADRLAVLNGRYPSVRTMQNFRELIEDPSIDAVAIATPVSTHYELALRALQEGKHVLVEKPLVSNTDQVQHLIEVAQKRNRVLMVDHTFVYTGAVRKIRELVESGGLGRNRWPSGDGPSNCASPRYKLLHSSRLDERIRFQTAAHGKYQSTVLGFEGAVSEHQA